LPFVHPYLPPLLPHSFFLLSSLLTPQIPSHSTLPLFVAPFLPPYLPFSLNPFIFDPSTPSFSPVYPYIDVSI
jgi:hypothetical protein